MVEFIYFFDIIEATRLPGQAYQRIAAKSKWGLAHNF